MPAQRAEALAIGRLETRTSEEMVVYPQIVRLAHAIIAEGFSDAVIQPGITTTDDVVWWYRQRIAELGDAKFAVRQRASKELSQIGNAADESSPASLKNI